MRTVNPIARPALVARAPRLANRGATITAALTSDHNMARELIRQLLAAPARAPNLYPRIADALRRHSHAEEQTFYKSLVRFPSMSAQIGLMDREHAQLAAMLRRLDRTAYNHPVWMSRFLAAKRALDNHLVVEEGRVFPESQRLLTLPQQRMLAAQYRALMNTARSRGRGPVALLARRVVRPARTLFDDALNLLFPVDR